MRRTPVGLLLCVVLPAVAYSPPALLAQVPAERAAATTGIRVGSFPQEVGRRWTVADGLPSDDVLAMAVAQDGRVYAGTTRGLARLEKGHWTAVAGLNGPVRALAARGGGLLAATPEGLFQGDGPAATRLAGWEGAAPADEGPWSLAAGKSVWLGTASGLWELQGKSLAPVAINERHDRAVRQVAEAPDGRVAVAAAAGLFVRDTGGAWRQVFPRAGKRESWAPVDARGVSFDARGRLWFACPQGVGRLDEKGWTLFTGDEGLPYDDFTTVAAGEDGVVWLGTTMGTIRYDGSRWEYRQGRRWLPDDRVRALAVDQKGNAYFATAQGVGAVERLPMTLAQKARFYEEEIDKYHRRTPYGYVLAVTLEKPGDKGRWTQHDSDNDGLWTSMYGAGECFAYAATKDPKARERARAAFEAVRFLSQVTQGGSHPAPKGFPARSILPTSGPDPNVRDSPERDRKARERDPYWKVIVPRWPVSADGKWYWKTDTSSDELDGHYFLYALYYDLVAETPEEKARVRDVVTAITDHMLEHDYDLIDHDGKPTRWARYGPKLLNKTVDASDIRGLKSLSILSYLKVAEHVSGDAKYRAAYESLIGDHDYDANTRDPKRHMGPGTGNQSDDEMAFMCYYDLLKYETDPQRRRTYGRSLRSYWNLEQRERCPLFNFILAARAAEPDRRWRGVPASCLEDALETLERFPLDRVQWGVKNSHRIDLVRMLNPYRELGGGRGHLRDGRVLPVDERFVGHWNHDPWRLDDGGNGRSLADGASFLLPYYMGLYHGFIVETTAAGRAGTQSP